MSNSKNSEPIRFAIPKNTRLRDDVFPLLEDALKLEEGPYAGIYKSPVLPNAVIFEAKIPDIVQFLRKKMIDVGVIGGDTFEEEIGIPWRRRVESLRYFPPVDNPEYYSAEEVEQAIQNEVGDFLSFDMFGERFATPLPEIRFLARKGEWGPSPVTNGKSLVVTPYPNIFGKEREELSQSFPGLLANLEPLPVEGNTEAFLSNRRVFPSVVAGMDIVRSGETTEKFQLSSFGSSVLKVYPSLVAPGGEEKERPLEILALLREKIDRVVESTAIFGAANELRRERSK